MSLNLVGSSSPLYLWNSIKDEFELKGCPPAQTPVLSIGNLDDAMGKR